MASGFNIASGADLDMVLAPQHPGWPANSATDFFDGNGNDLSLRYAALSTGSAVASNTGFVLASGSDIRTQFAAYGSTNVQVLTQPSAISGSAAAGSPFGTVTSDTATCAGEKGGGAYTYTWHIASGSGFSLTSPNSATTAVTGIVAASQTMTGSIYCTISDGVTSVNTDIISIALTNTSPAGFNFSLVAGSGGALVGFKGSAQGGAGPFGTLNGVSAPVKMTSGNYALEIADDGTDTYFVVSGLTADPSQSGLTELVVNGNALTGSSASYTWNSNTNEASWAWATNVGLVSGNSYSGTIVGTVAA